MSGIEEAALKLGLRPTTVRVMMEKKVIDIGYVIPNKTGRNTYIIVSDLLDKEVKRRGGAQ